MACGATERLIPPFGGKANYWLPDGHVCTPSSGLCNGYMVHSCRLRVQLGTLLALPRGHTVKRGFWPEDSRIGVTVTLTHHDLPRLVILRATRQWQYGASLGEFHDSGEVTGLTVYGG